MPKTLKEILKNKMNSNIEQFYQDYSKNIITNNTLYNLIKKECKLEKETDKNLQNFLNLKEKKNINDKQNKISIIIPTYNRKIQLKECLDSILNQTYTNFEIIIIDDCSHENIEKYLQKTYQDPRIKYIRNPENKGAGYSRKMGYQESTGKYIIFCDDDDYYIDSNFFENSIKIFKENDVSMICSNTYTKYEDKNVYKFNKLNINSYMDTLDYLEKFQFYYEKPNSTFSTIFKKSILEKSKFQSMLMVNDSSIYMRALLVKSKIYVIEEIIGIYRIHSNNMSFHIEADFLIENLKEKKYIYEQIVNNKLLDNPQKWFLSEILLTVKYYLDGENNKKEDINKIMMWLKQNAIKYNRIIIEINLYKVKKYIKNIIKNIIKK